MPTYKATALFGYSSGGPGTTAMRRQAGWSESMYWQGSDVDAMKRAFRNYCSKRAGLLPGSSRILGQRYQRVDPKGAAMTESQVFDGFQSDLSQDLPQVAALFTVPGIGVTNVRKFTYRGLPDDVVTFGEFSSPIALFNIQNCVRAMQGFSFKARRQDLQQQSIIGISQLGVFTLQNDLTFAVGDTLRVTNTKTAEGKTVNGEFPVTAKVDAKTGTFGNWKEPTCTGGRVGQTTYVYPLLDHTATVTPKAVTRKVGRPFGGFVGRASRRS